MTCSQFDLLIQQKLDGDLTPREQAALDAHLAGCEACRRAWEEYQSLGQAAGAWARRPVLESDPGEVFTARVMARIAAQAPAPAPMPLWSRLVLAGVAVVLLVCAYLFLPSSMTVAVPTPNLPAPPQTAVDLADTLQALWMSVANLPNDSARLWNDLPRSFTASGPMLGVLAGALLLNGLLYARTVRGPRGPMAR